MAACQNLAKNAKISPNPFGWWQINFAYRKHFRLVVHDVPQDLFGRIWQKKSFSPSKTAKNRQTILAFSSPTVCRQEIADYSRETIYRGTSSGNLINFRVTHRQLRHVFIWHHVKRVNAMRTKTKARKKVMVSLFTEPVWQLAVRKVVTTEAGGRTLRNMSIMIM